MNDATAASSPSPRAPGMKTGGAVLIVEDDYRTRRFLANVLTNNGFAVVAPETGAEALQQFRHMRPSVVLVLLDLAMPLLDVPAFVEASRSDPEFFAPVPIFGLGDLPDTHERAQCLGLVECLPKPVDPDTLLATVRRVCQRP